MTFLLAVSACATLGPEDVKYYVNSRKNCRLGKCRMNKDGTSVCLTFVQTKYLDKDEIFIKFGSEYITNGTLMLNIDEDDVDYCFKRKNDYKHVETKALIDKKLKESREIWEWEEQMEQKEKKRLKELQEKEEREKAKRIANERRKFKKSKNVVERELNNEFSEESDIEQIMRDITPPYKDEFETTADFKRRVKDFKDGVIKKYRNLVFKEYVSAKYNADKKEISISLPVWKCTGKNIMCMNILREKKEDGYFARNAFNAEIFVKKEINYAWGIALMTNFANIYENSSVSNVENVVIKNIGIKDAKKILDKLSLVVVGKLKDIEEFSNYSYSKPTFNNPRETTNHDSYINVVTKGICIANMLTKKCLVTFKPD